MKNSSQGGPGAYLRRGNEKVSQIQSAWVLELYPEDMGSFHCLHQFHHSPHRELGRDLLISTKDCLSTWLRSWTRKAKENWKGCSKPWVDKAKG